MDNTLTQVIMPMGKVVTIKRVKPEKPMDDTPLIPVIMPMGKVDRMIAHEIS